MFLGLGFEKWWAWEGKINDPKGSREHMEVNFHLGYKFLREEGPKVRAGNFCVCWGAENKMANVKDDN